MKSSTFTADSALLLDELRRDDDVAGAALDRVRERIAVSLTAAPMATDMPTATSRGGAPPAARAFTPLASKAGLAGALALGAALGAWGYSLSRDPAERVVLRDRAVEPGAQSATFVPSTPPPASPLAAPAAAAAALALPPSNAPAVPNPVAPSPSLAGAEQDSLVAELGLLDKARAALTAGDARTSLSILDAHARQYPRGALQQEREALRVKALVGAGRDAQARSAARRFAQTYPSSMLLDSVHAAIASIP